MNASDLARLAAGGETLTVEFKRATPKDKLGDDAIVSAVVCLANADGGTLLLGVEDDGSITGCAPRHGAVTDPRRLESLILARTAPPVSVTCEAVAMGEVVVVAVEIPAEPIPVGTSGGLFVRRRFGSSGSVECQPMTSMEILRRAHPGGERDLSATVARGVTFGDLDPHEFDRYRALLRVNRPGDALANRAAPDLLADLGLSAPSGRDEWDITFGALLCFGTEEALARHLPHHEIQLRVHRGSTLVADRTLRRPLFAAAEEVVGFLGAYNAEEEFGEGLLRIGVPLVPTVAAREAVVNALMHRDYAAVGPVSVEFTRDRFSVTSPGGLPQGVTIANLLSGPSRPRNARIAQAFHRIGLAEQAGRGVDRMYLETLQVGRAAPSFLRTEGDHVVVDFALGHADLDLARFVRRVQADIGGSLELVDLRILSRVKEAGRASYSDLAAAVPDEVGPLGVALARLVEQRTLDVRGTGRGRHYVLAREAVVRAGAGGAFGRGPGLEARDHDAAIERHVAATGSVSRSDVVALCGVTDPQATAILRRLREAGRLVQVGSKRGTHYVAP